MQGSPQQKLHLLALRRHYTNPHGLYAALRRLDPLYFDATSQSWLVTGHKVISAILDNPLFLSTAGTTVPDTIPQLSFIGRQMLFMDGWQHKQAQAVLLRPLAHLVKDMPELIRKFARDAIAEVLPEGEMEIVSDYASPLSLYSIAHVLGIPTEDRDLLQHLERWSDTFGDVTSGYLRGEMKEIENLEAYFRSLIALKRRVPGNDLISAFIEAQEVFSTDDDLVANAMMVFAAGRITTKKLLGNGLSLMMPSWGEQQHTVNGNRQHVRQLGEEMLRMITPTRYLIREASRDIDLSSILPGSHMIKQGQRLLLFLEAADYDPSFFPHPHNFTPARRPNKHLAFGFGPHQCPGATLARLEIQVALEEILTLSHVHPKPGKPPEWNPNPNLGGFISNYAVFSPGKA